MPFLACRLHKLSFLTVQTVRVTMKFAPSLHHEIRAMNVTEA